jgi:hypothetical protein
MKKILLIFLLLLILCPYIYSQRILFQSDFETIPLNADSLPNGWARFDEDHINPAIKWAVRDTACNFGGNTRVRTNNYSAKSLEIPWYAGNGGNFINDDWVFTDSLRIQSGDSLIFWMLIGSDTVFQNFSDSMQVLVSPLQTPVGSIETKLATIIAPDTNSNVWTIHKFSLSAFAGQVVYVVFRYYMDVSDNGLWCNIDDMFIGNRSAIGVQLIGTNVPFKFGLGQNYPNPFNPKTTINFDIAKSVDVKISIFNLLGQEVNTLVNQYMPAGSYKVDFDASNYASGTYYYRIITGDFVDTKKMVLVK